MRYPDMENPAESTPLPGPHPVHSKKDIQYANNVADGCMTGGGCFMRLLELFLQCPDIWFLIIEIFI
ncbi:MAG: hypothetical protein WCT04_08965 [Planctomycetota bacterium]